MQLEKAAMTPKRTVSPTSHHRDGNYGEPIYCPTTGDPCEGKISHFCDNQRCDRKSGLVHLWTRLNRPSSDKLTSRYESHQAEHESNHTDSLIRCESALEALLTNRGKPSRDVDRVLADDPQFILGHCLRAAIIVRADDIAARCKLVSSVTALETICPDVSDPGRRHAAAARAWLDGDEALAAERYGAIVSDWPRDILALVAANALDFRLGQRPCCGIASRMCCPNGSQRFLATQACLQYMLSASKRTANMATLRGSRVTRWHSTPDIQGLFMSSPM